MAIGLWLVFIAGHAVSMAAFTLRAVILTILQNKALSDPIDPVLALQGINWLVRKVVSMATVTMHVVESSDDDGITHIHTEQTATGGIKGETEVGKLDWSAVPNISGIFGETSNRSRWTGVGSSAESGGGGSLHPWLTEGWLKEDTSGDGNEHIQNWAVSEKKGWTAEEIWGFAMLDGKRYQVRKFLVKKGEQEARARMVYDWKGRMRAN